MRYGFCAFCLAVLMCAFSSPLRSGEVETVRFGVVMSLDGEFASMGRMHLAGVRMRMRRHNDEAAARGFRLEMVLRDDRSDAARAAELAAELLSDPALGGIVGSNATSPCVAMLPVVRDMNGVFISPSATNNVIGRFRDGAFRVLFDDAFQGKALARTMLERLGLKKAAYIVNGQYDYSRDVTRAFSQMIESGGGEMVGGAYYDRARDGDAVDFHALWREVMAEKPDVVLLSLYADDIEKALVAAGDLGVDAVVCGGDTWEQASVLDAAANHAAGAYYIGLNGGNADAPAMKDFLRQLERTDDEDAELGSALGYDALSLLIEALSRNRDRAALRETMYALGDVELTTGRIRIDDNGIGKLANVMQAVPTKEGVERKLVDVVEP